MLAPETVLHDRYRITYVVDEQPDSVIYRAIDTQQSLRVLIAALPQPHDAGLADVAHLAEQVVGVTTPGLLNLHDHFALGLTYYLVAEDPGGQDLERVARDRGGPLPEHEVLNYVERLLTALDVLHSRTPALLIGDLRSTDLWSSLDGGLFLAPFALARHVAAEPSPYRAPELHESSAEPTTASDIYAIGAVLYQMLTGWAPPTAPQRQANTPLNSPRILNARVSTLAEQLVLRALELKPVNRYQQAREMRSALETVRLMAGRPLGATAPLEGATGATPQVPPPPAYPPPGSPSTPEPGTIYGPPPAAPPPSPAQRGVQSGSTQGYGAPQPAAGPQWSGQYTTPPQPAPPPRQSGRISNGCLLAIVALLAVIALMICIGGAWVLWFVTTSQAGALPFPLPGGQATMATANPASPGTSAGPARPNPDTQAIIEAGAPYTETAVLDDKVVGAVLYAPDGALIAVGLGGTIELRDATTLEARTRLEGHEHEISALAFTPDGSTLASGAQSEQAIILWDVASGRELRRLEGHEGWIRSLAFSPDGSILASGSTDETIRFWDPSSGRELRRLEGHTEYLGNIAFSPDGATLASVSRDGTARLWDVTTARQREDFTYTAPNNPLTNAPFWLTGASFSPDGRNLAVGSVSGSVYILDAANGRLVRELQGHQGWVVIRGLSYSPDGNLLASASLDGTVRLWSPRTGAERGVLGRGGMRLLGLAWSPDSTMLAASSDTFASVTLWNAARQEVARTALLAQGSVTALSYTDSGAAIATGGINGSVIIHALDGGNRIPLNGGAPTSQYLAFLSDTQLVAVSDGGEVVVLTIAGQADEPRRPLEGVNGLALSVEVSRDRRLIAAGTDGGEVVIWDARTFEVMKTLRGLDGPVYALTMNRDGSQLAAVSNTPLERPKVVVWDVASGNRRATFSGHAAPVTAVAMPASADVVATTSSDGTLKLWEAGSGNEVRSQSVPEDGAWYSSLTFSPDGTLMATGSIDGQVEFWIAADGRRLNGVDLSVYGGILGLAFRPDGGQLAVATRDGGVVLLEAGL